jgi:hypothetical protein
MSVTPTTWFWNGATVWDANVHYRIGPSLNSYLGILAGYGGISLNPIDPGHTGSTSGFRIGAEFMVRQPAGWYFTGEGTYGPSWNSSFPAFPAVAAGNITDLRAAVGYEFSGGWGLEGGWRYVNWAIPNSAGCTGGCNFQFSGVTAALTFRR